MSFPPLFLSEVYLKLPNSGSTGNILPSDIIAGNLVTQRIYVIINSISIQYIGVYIYITYIL
jgi:hypothetical protein